MAPRNLRDILKKRHSCEDLLCCILGLSSTDAAVLASLHKPMCVKEIMEAVKRSQTRVQISLNHLTEIGMIRREPIKSRRGRKYIYHPVDTGVLKKRLEKELRATFKQLMEEIGSLTKEVKE